MSYLLKNGILPNGAKTDLAIQDQLLVSPDALDKNHRIIELDGKQILPGLVDLHTHLREPGFEEAETVATGSLSAVRGGYTAISAMANTSPVADTAGVVEQVFRLGQLTGLCDVFPIGAVTQGLNGEALSEIGAMADSSARVRVFSDDGKCVFDPLIMRRALEYVKKFDGVIAQHAQEPGLTIGAQMNEGEISAQLGLKGWPAVAEEAIIARDVLLAEHTKSRLHICHLTTAGGVEIIRGAKSRGVQVTAEVTPHHLLLTDDYAKNYDPIFKVNPPLRLESDVLALRAGLADGTIDIVATDHAPHSLESKDCEWAEASFGMVGLETALSIVIKTMVETGAMDYLAVADRLSIAPARIGRYETHGQSLEVGKVANLTIVDTAAKWIVDRDLMSTRSKNTPFHGFELPGVVTHTFFNGKLVFGG